MKRIIILAMAIVMILMVSGCSTNNSSLLQPNPMNDTTTQYKPISISETENCILLNRYKNNRREFTTTLPDYVIVSGDKINITDCIVGGMTNENPTCEGIRFVVWSNNRAYFLCQSGYHYDGVYYLGATDNVADYASMQTVPYNKSKCDITSYTVVVFDTEDRYLCWGTE